MSAGVWTIFSLGAVVATLAVTLWMLRDVGDLRTRLLCLALWLRLALGAFAQYTTVPLAAGLSVNALGSLAVIGAGMLLFQPRFLALRKLWPMHLYLGIGVLSGLMNGAVGLLAMRILDWSYMIIVAALLHEAIRVHGPDRALRLVFPIMVMPVFLGLASYAVGYGQYSEHDGSTSFRGGYLHESLFSIIIYTTLTVALLIKWRAPALRAVFVILALAGIMLANYRTTVLALLPVFALLGYEAFLSVVPRRYRASALILGVMAGAMIVMVGSQHIPDRYADIISLGRLDSVEITEPSALTEVERSLMSGRLYIWSLYLHEYANADALRHIIGFGPDAWKSNSTFFGHAHNNFILDLYSVGVVGVIALMLLYAWNIALSASLEDRHYATSLVAAQVGFLMINLATSPFNVLEGLLFYAFILAMNLSLRSRASRRIAAPSPRSDPQPAA
jgi:hypothetical protein